MQVQVLRRGGLAGVRLQGSVDTRELSPAEATHAEATLRELPFGRSSGPPSHPDAFQYEITLQHEGSTHCVVLDEAEVPDALRPIVDAAVARGAIV
jgi:hypothetical protein